MPKPSSTAGHRLALALFALALVPLAFFASRPSEAEARVVWCAGDPAIIVNGNVVSVTVHLPFDRLRDVDHVEVIFHVPADASVTALINDSLLFEARTSFVRDLPRQGRRGLFSGTPVNAEIIVHHKGDAVDVAATTLAIGRGTRVWQQGNSSSPLWVETEGALNLPILNWGLRFR
jgi:hypothetical protein